MKSETGLLHICSSDSMAPSSRQRPLREAALGYRYLSLGLGTTVARDAVG